MTNPITTGIADRFPTKIFETDVAAVSAGVATGGWVSGSPANLALSASANVLFDLGQDWHQYTSVNLAISSVGPSSGLSNVQVSSSDTNAINTNRRLKDIGAVGPGAIAASITTAGGVQQLSVRPMGRYLFVSVTNADGANAQGATAKITMATSAA